MKDNLKKAYTEVIELLKYFSEEDVKMIPDEKIEHFLKYKDNEYEYKVDETKKFYEQNMLPETKVIFANIYKDYWASDYQKKLLALKEKIDRKKIDDEKKKIYNPDDIFKKNRN